MLIFETIPWFVNGLFYKRMNTINQCETTTGVVHNLQVVVLIRLKVKNNTNQIKKIDEGRKKSEYNLHT